MRTEEQIEAKRIYNKAYYIANREKEAKRAKIWRLDNPDKVAGYQKIWFAANPKRTADSTKKYAKANPAKMIAKENKRRANKLRATPVWADDFILEEAYELAILRTEATGVKHHVDHIVPLQSKIVCGLHCEFNLRVIPGKENISKGNRHWPDMP